MTEQRKIMVVQSLEVGSQSRKIWHGVKRITLLELTASNTWPYRATYSDGTRAFLNGYETVIDKTEIEVVDMVPGEVRAYHVEGHDTFLALICLRAPVFISHLRILLQPEKDEPAMRFIVFVTRGLHRYLDFFDTFERAGAYISGHFYQRGLPLPGDLPDPGFKNKED